MAVTAATAAIRMGNGKAAAPTPYKRREGPQSDEEMEDGVVVEAEGAIVGAAEKTKKQKKQKKEKEEGSQKGKKAKKKSSKKGAAAAASGAPGEDAEDPGWAARQTAIKRSCKTTLEGASAGAYYAQNRFHYVGESQLANQTFERVQRGGKSDSSRMRLEAAQATLTIAKLKAEDFDVYVEKAPGGLDRWFLSARRFPFLLANKEEVTKVASGDLKEEDEVYVEPTGVQLSKVEDFVAATHQALAKTLAERFLGRVPGMFIAFKLHRSRAGASGGGKKRKATEEDEEEEEEEEAAAGEEKGAAAAAPNHNHHEEPAPEKTTTTKKKKAKVVEEEEEKEEVASPKKKKTAKKAKAAEPEAEEEKAIEQTVSAKVREHMEMYDADGVAELRRILQEYETGIDQLLGVAQDVLDSVRKSAPAPDTNEEAACKQATSSGVAALVSGIFAESDAEKCAKRRISAAKLFAMACKGKDESQAVVRDLLSSSADATWRKAMADAAAGGGNWLALINQVAMKDPLSKDVVLPVAFAAGEALNNHWCTVVTNLQEASADAMRRHKSQLRQCEDRLRTVEQQYRRAANRALQYQQEAERKQVEQESHITDLEKQVDQLRSELEKARKERPAEKEEAPVVAAAKEKEEKKKKKKEKPEAEAASKKRAAPEAPADPPAKKKASAPAPPPPAAPAKPAPTAMDEELLFTD